MKKILLIAVLLTTFCAFSQIIPNNGAIESTPAYFALKNARIVVSPSETIENATLLIKDSKIVSVGKLTKIPKDAVIIDCKGKTILPAFIELNSDIGLPKIKRGEYTDRQQYESNKKGAYHWNESIHPEINANAIYSGDAKSNKELVEKGFGFALTHQKNGISRGQGAFVSLTDGKESLLTIEDLNSFYSFQKGASRQSYPSSQMGAIALLRQSFYDADWYKANSENKNVSFDNLLQQLNGNKFFETSDKFEIIRANKIAEEFNLKFTYFGSGNEYEILDQISSVNSTIILPINFPKPYDVENPYISRQIPLSDLKHWEMAPMNPMLLKHKGVNICITSTDHKTSEDFWSHLRAAIKHGLTESEALEALTTMPAITIGAEKIVGTLEAGKLASFIVYDKNPFIESAQMMESWMVGKQTIHKTSPNTNLAGEYNLTINNHKFPFEIKKTGPKFSGELTYEFTDEEKGVSDTTAKLLIINNDLDVTLQFNIHSAELDGSITLQGKANSSFGVFEGEGMLPNGEWVKWAAIKTKKTDAEKSEAATLIMADTNNRSWLPNMAYGFDSIPETTALVIKNATLWTNEEIGILNNATVVVKDGKIVYAGSGKYKIPKGSKIIDAKGKHITSGIIDEHSHIAISKGVNEGGQAISAEVRIGDVVNPDDINIYRQLSGGVTTAQLLHGSANPVGGQSALIKLKWGHTADEMIVDRADGFIKFALGENVKQSRSSNSIRFPQTRMGVEQLYYDGFLRAREYEKEWSAYRLNTKLSKPRKDLELETLVEILQGKRFVTCHSYVQSEINMLMHVADSMGFNINTFTHILEGYKVADKMVKHGVGGSTFSDWWAYKYEVNDAIPYNAAIMSKQGVVVAINSDDAEMGRRLNQEAAKGIKYGGMTEIEAWKMVTLNPAKLLHIDDQMGSLKEGKDADIVIWSDNPLSINAKVEYTIVDGQILYSQEKNAQLRKRNQQEKARIISKMLADETPKLEKKRFIKKKKGHFHCNTLGEELSTEENHH